MTTKIIQAVCNSYGITEEELKSEGRKRITADARACIVYLMLSTAGATPREAAKVVNRSRTIAYNCYNRYVDLIASNKIEHARFCLIEKELEINQ